MPYNYESLKNHVSAVHPELLDAFVEGWNQLGPQSQDHWRQRALITPAQKVVCQYWSSWTNIKRVEFFKQRGNLPFDIPLSKFEKQLAILFHDSMQHGGDLFHFPYMPPVRHIEYESPTGRSSSERHMMAKDAAKTVIHTALRKLLMEWKEDLEENGLEALRKVYLVGPQLKDNEKMFNFSDFNSDLNCDSGSDMSDED